MLKFFLPALASSTGVGLWRLNSSVCHIDVISLTYIIKVVGFRNDKEKRRIKELLCKSS